MTRLPQLSFIIPVRNDAARLRRCLQSIAVATRDIPAEVIVIDNGSTDSSPEVARAAGCQVLVVPHERVGSLRNRGAAVAQGELLAFVDADHEIGAGWARTALDVMNDPACSAAGSPCVPPRDATWVQRSYNGFRDHAASRHVVDWLGSGNMIVRRRIFEGVGGFDVALDACEDVDLCRRIRETGGVIVSDPGFENIHYGDPASLTALFIGELWRGRNNMRVTLRERPSLRSLPSLVIPMVQLALLAIAIVAGVTGRLLVPAACVAGIFGLSLLRATRVRRRTMAPVVQAAAVAVTYDAARALALFLRTQPRRVVAHHRADR